MIFDKNELNMLVRKGDDFKKVDRQYLGREEPLPWFHAEMEKGFMRIQ